MIITGISGTNWPLRIVITELEKTLLNHDVNPDLFYEAVIRYSTETNKNLNDSTGDLLQAVVSAKTTDEINENVTKMFEFPDVGFNYDNIPKNIGDALIESEDTTID